MPADRARRHRDQLPAPAAHPGVQRGGQVGGELRHLDGVRDALDELRGPPPLRAPRRRVDLVGRQAPERGVDRPGDPARVAAVVGDDEPGGAGERRQRHGGRSGLEAVDGRLRPRRHAEGGARREGADVLAEGRLRGREPLDAAQPREDVQLGLDARQQRDEHPRARHVRRDRGGEGGQHGGRERRQRGAVDRQPVRVERGADHLQAHERGGLEPVRDDRADVAAGVDARGHRLDHDLRLLARGRLDEGVDPALGSEEPLRFEAEREDDRPHGRLRLRGRIRHRAHLTRSPGAAGPL
ncbi:MAG: hypothetical protein AVDCRST_MAG30-4025 [uncultured Solirubrobacteraceae bacterium]|uniref:Uncharacterized protein n=1 Tax=uncultured Solirubrobacteraceae bacterium TaxID=1162706 RepID=A0A6J4TXU8_9ACTN|nr:MAG: hypothetical protein AVDCRST_MAG30-4025 [uncultured Solirubrobacteraceae bacterium]